MEPKGRTIRQAIAVALEGLPGTDLHQYVVLAKQRNAMREHVRLFVHDFARNRGVILSDHDIADELEQVIDELRRGVAMRGVRLVKLVVYFGQKAKIACDGMCHKAWGRSNRPREQLSAADDDFAWLADDELNEAPADPGTYEGGQGKPRGPVLTADQMNRWCARECERCTMSAPGELELPLELRDFSTRYYNIAPHKRDP